MHNTLASRIEYIDIFRAFGIIFMVMGHIWYGEKFDYFIHAFHMPMFFFVSGYFYKRKDESFIKLIAKKSKTLLIPYVSFGLFHWIIECRKGIVLTPLLHLLSINTYEIPIAGALWFLTALFITDILFNLLDRKNLKWLIIPLVLIGSYADQVLPYPLPWAMSAAFVGLGLYWIGNYVRTNEKKFYKLLNLNVFGILILGAVITVLIFLNGYINMRTGTYGFLPLFWINVVLSIFVGISISKYVTKIIYVKDYLTGIGQNSIVYLCLNQLVIIVATKLVQLFIYNVYVSKIMILVITLIGLYVASLILIKTKLRIFIGK